MSYEKIGLKCGIEIHQQLAGRKLFGPFPSIISEDNSYDFEVKRFIRAAAGESGTVDAAAAHETKKQKYFIYRGKNESAGLVELDEQPPIPVDEKALYTAVQFSKMVNAAIIPIVQVMRKTIADGSNTTGFQRTALLARDGCVDTTLGKVRIANISLEEDSCRTLETNPEYKIYHLDRLGIPLIEVGTEPDIKTPEHCQEVAQQLGMLLRSLPTVKRGLGTIRQDVNISIKGGARIEIKGAQDLRQIPLLVELEVKRQQELLEIKKSLKGKKLEALKIVDVTALMKKSSTKFIQQGVKQGKALAIRVQGFADLLGKELQPGYRLGTELSGRAQIIAGVGGIIHSDEDPKKYGLTASLIKEIEQVVGKKTKDGFIIVVAPEQRARLALEAVHERLGELYKGIPKEVRRAQPDGTTKYLRPLPGAARMYPETDVPLIYPDVDSVTLPELLQNKILRFQKQYQLSADLAKFIAKSDFSSLFEEIIAKYEHIKPAFIADVLTSVLVELRRKYSVDPTVLTEEHFRLFFKCLSEDKIHKDITIPVLIDMCKGEFSIEKYASLSTEEVHKIMKKIITNNPKAPFPALMGLCMKELAGKASGKFIAQELKRLMK